MEVDGQARRPSSPDRPAGGGEPESGLLAAASADVGHVDQVSCTAPLISSTPAEDTTPPRTSASEPPSPAPVPAVLSLTYTCPTTADEPVEAEAAAEIATAAAAAAAITSAALRRAMTGFSPAAPE